MAAEGRSLMHAAVKTIGILGAGIFLGVHFSPAPDAPTPETHIVRIKTPAKVITHKETKYVTKTVVTPLPKSCTRVVEYGTIAAGKSNAIYNSAEEYFTYIDRLTLRNIDNPDAVNEVDQWLNERKNKLNVKLYELLSANRIATDALELCVKDTKK